MTENEEELIPVFVPALSAVLLHAEDQKGSPLTSEEVTAIRDKSACIMMTESDQQRLNETRGYYDIDPENCWYEFQLLRKELGRKPDLDPGAKINQINSSDPAYLRTIQQARKSIGQFRKMLPRDGTPLWNAMIKIRIAQADNTAYMWLSNVRRNGKGFIAEFFEIPSTLTGYSVGDQTEIAETEITDWMVNDDGLLHGGFSIRYQRERLPEDERDDYDAYIGISEYG